MSSKSNADQHVVSAAPETVELTAYQQGPAVIRETRKVTLADGRSTLQLDGLPLQFVPGSLTVVSADGAGKFKMISTSFRNANLSLTTILAKAIGSHIVLSEDTQRGIVDHTGKLLHIVDGRTAVLQEDDGAESVKLVPITNKVTLADGLPDGLSALASLVMDVEAAKNGGYNLNNLYESEGVNWRPWYEAFYDHDSGKLVRFACYVELSNNSGTDFEDAGIKLIAGANHSVNAQPKHHRGARMQMLSMEAAPAADFGETHGGGMDYEEADVESVGEQKMYTLPDTVSLENGETQNPALVFATDVPVDHEYHLDASWYAARRKGSDDDLPKLPVKVKLRLKNDSSSNLGIALPPGRVRVLEPDSSGQLQKTDSTTVRGHIARNEKFILELGNPARDIKASRELTYQHIDPEIEKKDDNFIDEGPHPLPVQPMEAEEGGMPEVRMTMAAPTVVDPGKHDRIRRDAVENAAAGKEEEEKEAPRFQEEERVVRLYNYGEEDVTVHVHENIPANAEFLQDDTGFTRFSEASSAGAFEVSVPAGSDDEPGELTITYRIKWQIN